MSKIKINRAWAMPNKNTFNIKPIKNLIDRYDCNNLFTQKKDFISIDPFANKNKIAKHTNDIDKEYHTTYNLDALKFVKLFTTNSVDFVLYDPPYSPRQLSECYKKLGRSVTLQDTQSTFWSKLKKEVQYLKNKQLKWDFLLSLVVDNINHLKV